MQIGFTGTQKGMTAQQRAAVRDILIDETKMWVEGDPFEAHHGDCVGSDDDFDAIVVELDMGITIVVHPPVVPDKRAFCARKRQYANRVELPADDYLSRDRAIVEAGLDLVIATPKDYAKPESLRGQGTWYTVNHAEGRQDRRIAIVHPDGTGTTIEGDQIAMEI